MSAQPIQLGVDTISVIVPTYNERENVEALIRRLETVLPAERSEVLVVDDSSDDTPDVVRAVAAASTVPVRLIHRPPNERTGGLGGAVLLGLREATGEWAVVMDGDLQHPPERVPALIAAATQAADPPDAVVASRYRSGGDAGGLDGGWRRWGSSGAGGLAKLLFPRSLRDCTDPMSGFFLVRRASLEDLDLRPDGFKILLEILVRISRPSVTEVPFTFADRHGGESKANWRQAAVYLRHLVRLRMHGQPARLAGFLAIGASGLIPNLAVMLLLDSWGVNYLVSTVIATYLAMTWNFVLSDLSVFRGRRSGQFMLRYLGYLVLNVADIVIRLPLMAVLVEVARLGVVSATLVSTVLMSSLRFAALDKLIYRAVPLRVPVVGEAQPRVPRPRRSRGARRDPEPPEFGVFDAA